MVAIVRKPVKALKLAAQILASPTQRRHFFRWVSSGRPRYLLNHAAPWITFDAIDFLKARARPDMRVFEFGSGGSTLFWASLGAQVTSIEHNPAWYEILKPRLAGNSRIDCRLVLPQPLTVPRADA